jgi:MerR family transcriptional regulator/heat shock protein HspR
MSKQAGRTRVTVSLAARQTGVSPRSVRRYIHRGLISKPLTESGLHQLRRIRRLRELGIDLCGIEVILHMRRQIQELRAEVARLRRLGRHRPRHWRTCHRQAGLRRVGVADDGGNLGSPELRRRLTSYLLHT